MALLSGILFVWVNALAIRLSVRLSHRLLPAADTPLRWLSSAVLFVAFTDLCLFGLGSAGLLAALPQLVLVTVVAGVESAIPLARSTRQPLERPPWSRADRAAVALAGALALIWCGRVFALAPELSWDDLAYHAVSPAWWLKHGELSVAPFNYQAYYPMSAELHSLWFMLPYGTDVHANLASLSWLALAVSAWVVIGARLGTPPRWIALVLCAFLLTPEVRLFGGQFTPIDLAYAATMLATVALTVRRAGRERPVPLALLCGLAAGLALGTRVTAAPLVLVVGLLWLVRVRGGRAGPGAAAAYGLAALALASYWYARNLALSGNPVFPAELGPFDGPFRTPAQDETRLVRFVVERWQDPVFWKSQLLGWLDWALPLGILAVLGYGLGIRRLVRATSPAARELLLLLLVVGLATLTLFPFQPFSGTPNRVAEDPLILVRYLTLPYLLGLVLLSVGLARRASPAGAPAQSADCALSGRARLPGWAPGAALVLVLAAGALLAPAKAADARERIGSWDVNGPIGPGWLAVDELPPGSRVAAITFDPPALTAIYPLFGRRFQLEPVALTWDGAPRQPLHEVWKQYEDWWWWEQVRLIEEESDEKLIRNLNRAGLDFLLVSKWPRRVYDESSWPRVRWMLADVLPRTRRVWNDEFTEIWDLRGNPRDYVNEKLLPPVPQDGEVEPVEPTRGGE